jgi:UDP-N-acetylmuramate--alanine ligase
MPIYSAGEENTYDITSEKLAQMIGKDVLVCEKEEIEEIVKNNKESNEIFIFMGAGSVSKVAHDITNKL